MKVVVPYVGVEMEIPDDKAEYWAERGYLPANKKPQKAEENQEEKPKRKKD